MTKKWIYGVICAAVVVTFGLIFAGCSKSPEKSQAQLEAAEQKAEVTSTKTEASSGKETAKTTGAPKDTTPKFTAESDFEVDRTADGEGIVINKYVGNGGTIIIPATIQGFPVREIGRSAFRGVDAVAVVIPASVTNIGEFAFQYNENLISVDVPVSVKSIGYMAFWDTGITAVTIYAGTMYDSGVYGDCKALRTVTIQDGVTAIGGNGDLFSDCISLTTVSIPDSVVKIGSAFPGCANLTNVTFSPDIKREWNDYAFNNCPKLPLATQAALRKAGYTGSF